MRYIITFLIIFISSTVFANTDKQINSPYIKTIGVGAISGISSALSQSDVALCKSMIYPKHLKGDYGESIVGKFYLEHHLKKSGNWESISARFGRQGIDQIYLKYDRLGRIRDIMVGEVKYGSSKLGMTKDGIQMGNRWTQKRLIALGNRYLEAASAKNTIFQKRLSKLSANHQIEVNLGNGKKAIFWRKNALEPWKYEGSKEDFKLSLKKAKSTGQYVKKSGENIIRVKSRIFEVKTDNKFININIKDASLLDSGFSQNRIKGQSIKIDIKGFSGKLSNEVLSKEIAKQIKSKITHLSDKECLNYARKIVKEINTVENFTKYPYAKSVLSNSLKAGVGGAIFSIGIEAISQGIRGEADYQRLFETGALGFGSVGVGSAVGQITTASLMESKVAHAVVTRTASSIGISTSFLSNTIGSSVGGGITSLLFAYGGYFLGYYDSYTANKTALSGLVGVGGGTLASAGTLALVTTYATAGTGTAISSLSGAAATNAGLAWLGGGTVASGGGGMAWGAAALGGVFTVGIVAATAITACGINLYEKNEDNKMLKLSLKDYIEEDSFRNQAKRLYPLSNGQ